MGQVLARARPDARRFNGRPGLVAELPPKLARAPAGRGDFGPRMGGTLSTHSTLGTWVRRESFLPVQNHFSKACWYPKLFWSSRWIDTF